MLSVAKKIFTHHLSHSPVFSTVRWDELGALTSAPAQAANQEDVIQQLHYGRKQTSHIGEGGRVQHLVHAALFLLGLDNAGLIK